MWVLQNPPFGQAVAPSWYKRGTGKVSQSAVFVSAWISGAQPGQRMVAILPDVLRAGSRYRSWREEIEMNCSVVALESLGQFDRNVNIDVFLLSLRRTKTAQQARWWDPLSDTNVSARSATVSVGTVVPHRDPLLGRKHPYLTAANLPLVSETAIPAERRADQGRRFKPPLVAIRRTSRPGQRPRARATIVRGVAEILAENHLIIVEPTNGTLGECRRIARHLESAEASAWLDQRLRARHLTAVAIRELLADLGD
jgi:hypothetical protein